MKYYIKGPLRNKEGAIVAEMSEYIEVELQDEQFEGGFLINYEILVFRKIEGLKLFYKTGAPAGIHIPMNIIEEELVRILFNDEAKYGLRAEVKESLRKKIRIHVNGGSYDATTE